MKRIRVVIAAAALMLPATASQGQIATPTLSLPPCSGQHCLVRHRGATTEHAPSPSVRKLACPQGTIYDAYKGDCRVMPLAR